MRISDLIESTKWSRQVTAYYMGVHINTLYKWLTYEKGKTGGRKPSKSALQLADLLDYINQQNPQAIGNIYSELPDINAIHPRNGINELLDRPNNHIGLSVLLLKENKRTVNRWKANAHPEKYSKDYRREPSAATNKLALVMSQLLKSKEGSILLEKHLILLHK